jgi:hypothetical protein
MNAAARLVGAPLSRLHVEKDPAAYESVDGSTLREDLIRRGVLVPAARVVPKPFWWDSPTTCRLLGTEDHRTPPRVAAREWRLRWRSAGNP